MNRSLFPLLLLVTTCACAQQNLSEVQQARKFYREKANQFNKGCKLRVTGDCPCSNVPPWTVILPSIGRDRVTRFQEKRRATKLPNFPDDIELSLKGLKAVLTTVTRKDKNYDGLRVYFAACPDSSTRPMLLFVPTVAGRNAAGKKIHADDASAFMALKGDDIQPVDTANAKLWTTNAYANFLDSFDKDLKKNRPKSNETQALWYNRWVIDSTDVLHNGLIQLLECLDCCGQKYVYAKFAAFLNGLRNSSYQLTLIYNFSRDSKSFISLDLKDAGKPSGVDTGNPCPPPKPCSLSGSAILTTP